MEVYIKVRLAPLLMLCMLLAVISPAGAGAASSAGAVATFDWNSLTITLESENATLQRTPTGGKAFAHAYNDIDPPAEDGPADAASASVTYASAGADIDTSDNRISSESTVQPFGADSRATADANAYYHERFSVEGADSLVTITVNYTLLLALSTHVPGDSALGRARVDLEFGNHDSGQSLVSNDEIPGEVLDGDSLPEVTVTGMLTLELDFLEGEAGYFTLSADTLGDVYNTEAIPGDFDDDGQVCRTDLNIILSHRNQPADACPQCDLDGDGTITVLDARKLILMCTNPRCLCNP